MLIRSFPAGAFGTNCYAVASGPGAECVVVDPGMEALEPLRELLAADGLKPVAVVLTHGHLDHTFSVLPVCEGYGIPAYLHPADSGMLSDPMRWHGPALAPLIGQVALPDPADVLSLDDGATLSLAGVDLTVRHAPGHTEGSVVFSLDLGEGPGLLAGDVLFAGSVGRVDLPGGSWEAMLGSLRDVVLPLDDATVVLPGHGPATTIGRERATNPYLAEAAAAPKGRGL
ncbi:MBL fold metallo-hydrolase [Modestobacter sp. I12A-02628]|uniref:MBL fold metallo-hydrolase n=1 Tax=Goekera deserti TaxID=2497753 RepID=A0A7K3WA39_9ACTN|nr:MBL fold metallo-hydrolase [Goekera deserti]MPQ99176.1 MBL fold metallo-hydrolase [Goekera deserti]NDI47511.1 MBL fold metallo-hydrolase [Goekera deserti]NEL53322.1 MBL fold metallo-hydrolase [Goekera deserti]